MKNYLVLGDWNAICDRCGFKFKASMLRKEWDGVMVCSACYEQRHPQDFLRVRQERIATPWARPEAPDSFLNPDDVILTEDGDWILTENGASINTEA